MKPTQSKTIFILLSLELGLSGFSQNFQNPRRIGGLAWWIWLLFIVLLVAVVVFWAWSISRSRTSGPPDRMDLDEHEWVGEEPEVAQTAAAAPVPGDLTIIAGIDLNIAELLNANGIETFSELAGTNHDRLDAILVKAGLEVNPGTWPEQARLAAEGKWDELEDLQNSLRHR